MMKDTRTSRWLISLSAITLWAFCAAPALAQGTPDLSGDWSLDTTAVLPVPETATLDGDPGGEKGTVAEDCTFSGTASLAQDGTEFSGPAELDLVSGVVGCPGMLVGEINGTIDPMVLRQDPPDAPYKGLGTPIAGQITDPDLGVVNFTGTVDPAGPASGPYDAVQGSFTGAFGSWAAAPLVATPLEIPTTTPEGLASLAVLLAAAGLYWLIRR